MLSLAKELVNDPVLLLVDEPSAGLAPRIAHLVYDELVAARARGVTLLLIDQNITKAVEISDYLYMIEGGQVRREGPREHFAADLPAFDHVEDRKSTRLNSSHSQISYAVFCLKKKKKITTEIK